MKSQSICRQILFLSLVVLLIVSAQLQAQSSSPRRPRMGLFGDWEIKVQFGERQMDSILSFSRNAEGQYTGQWISFWGAADLKDVKFEENKLSFVQVMRFGENEFSSNFSGTIQDANLTGTLANDRGESKVEGKRSRRMPRVAGKWEMNYKGVRDITSILVIKVDKQGELAAEWQSERLQSEITDVNYERGVLTFTRKASMGDRQWESTFEGRIQSETGVLLGTIKSDRGEIEAQGKRIGADLIGTWNLELTSERGTRKQRLVVNPDMSALYGAAAVKQVTFEDGKVGFKIVRQFGERTFESTFEAKLAESKLTGKLTSSMGTSEVVGTRVVHRFGRPATR